MENRAEILQSITEAREHLERLEAELKDPDFNVGGFKVWMEHVYHDLNFAWNIRNESKSDIWECSPENYTKWSKFPVGEIDEFELEDHQ